MSARTPILSNSQLLAENLQAVDHELIERAYQQLSLEEQQNINDLASHLERNIKRQARLRGVKIYYVLGRRGTMELLLKLHLHMLKRGLQKE